MALSRCAVFILLLTCLEIIPGCQTRSFSRDALAFVHPGETLRSEVVENLGQPSWEASNRTAIAYIRGIVAGKKSQWALRQEQSVPVVTTTVSEFGQKKEALCFAFDEKDRVTRMGILHIPPGTEAGSAVEAWSGAAK